MISHCPHCSQALRFSDAYKEKLSQALAKLPQGKNLKFACPKCKTPIELNKDGDPVVKVQAPAKPAGGEKPPETADSGRQKIVPPGAPDISWLSAGEQEEEELLDDVPTAMILLRDAAVRGQVIASLRENKFQIFEPGTIDEAIESMRFKEFAVVVYAGDYDQGPLESQDFHKYMSNMSMKKRRKMFYILMGPEFKTLYDLQALTLSANLVVNTAEVPHMPRLLKKGLKDYEDLFAPYMALLKQRGKN